MENGDRELFTPSQFSNSSCVNGDRSLPTFDINPLTKKNDHNMPNNKKSGSKLRRFQMFHFISLLRHS